MFWSFEFSWSAAGVLDGTVRDGLGNLLAGVEVTTEGKSSITDPSGWFHLAGIPTNAPASGSSPTLRVEKAGFVRRWSVPFEPGTGPIELAMEREPEIKGRVVGPDGHPVAGCTVWAGPGHEPPQYASRKTSSGPDGAFVLSVGEKCETNWVGVSASRFAPWFGNVAASNLEREVVCRLIEGAEVKLRCSGMALNPADLRAKLRLQRMAAPELVNADDPSQQQSIATFEAEPDADGVIRFRHVAPGHYRVGIRGPRFSPMGVDVTVGDTTIDLGNFTLHGTGTVAGRIFPSGKDLVNPPYAQGEIESSGTGLQDEEEEPRRFTTDAMGFFRVEHVPVGPVRLLFPYYLSADMRSAIVRRARVFEGKTTSLTISAGERGEGSEEEEGGGCRGADLLGWP